MIDELHNHRWPLRLTANQDIYSSKPREMGMAKSDIHTDVGGMSEAPTLQQQRSKVGDVEAQGCGLAHAALLPDLPPQLCHIRILISASQEGQWHNLHKHVFFRECIDWMRWGRFPED